MTREGARLRDDRSTPGRPANSGQAWLALAALVVLMTGGRRDRTAKSRTAVDTDALQ